MTGIISRTSKKYIHCFAVGRPEQNRMEVNVQRSVVAIQEQWTLRSDNLLSLWCLMLAKSENLLTTYLLVFTNCINKLFEFKLLFDIVSHYNRKSVKRRYVNSWMNAKCHSCFVSASIAFVAYTHIKQTVYLFYLGMK